VQGHEGNISTLNWVPPPFQILLVWVELELELQAYKEFSEARAK
jgi:hypothetical protein